MDSTGRAEYLVNEAGCGLFQILLVIFTNVLPKSGTVYTMMFMAFGNYNPGWRCMDRNNTSSSFNASVNSSDISNVDFTTNNGTMDIMLSSIKSGKDNETVTLFKEGSCEVFESCKNIEFDPDTSSIVTEWNLLCDNAWVPSLIISVQMAGVLVGSLFAGQLGDTFGRKKMLYIPLCLCGIINIAAIFSPNWQVYIFLRFCTGVTCSSLFNVYNLYPGEFLNSIWRVRVAAIPSWPGGGLLFAVSAMLFKDWKKIHLTTGIYFLIACIPSVWVPESLRWLGVKNKSEEFESVAKKIIKMNKMPPVELDRCDQVELAAEAKSNQETTDRVYTALDLFRKGYRLKSVLIGFMWFTPMLVFYGIVYSVQAMHGNFYINLIIMFSPDILYSILPMNIPNIIGRRKSIILFMTVSGVSLLIATGFGLMASPDIRDTGSLVLALLAKMNVTAALTSCQVLTAESYPTVVRGNAISYANVMARVGGIIAPLLIANDYDDLHICYGILGTFCLLCCLSVYKVSETKGKKMKEVFDES